MIMERIKEAEAGFRSLTEAIDTTTAPGRMMMQMVGAFAEFERAILRERTMTGLDAARKRGCIGGRRPKLRPDQQDEIVAMISKGTKTGADAARLFNVHPATVSRILARAGAGTIRVNATGPFKRSVSSEVMCGDSMALAVDWRNPSRVKQLQTRRLFCLASPAVILQNASSPNPHAPKRRLLCKLSRFTPSMIPKVFRRPKQRL